MRGNGLFYVLLIFVLLLSCRKNDEITLDSGAKLSFSTDTIMFDTVFSTFGSLTLNFRIYNKNDKGLVTNVELAGGDNSPFRLNVDGFMSSIVSGYEIRANDSSYVFVEVTIDPQNTNSPILVEDSIIFRTNGNIQVVKLVAYGQDVFIIDGETIKTTTWTAGKPYLIFNSVIIDSLETLNITQGTRIYFHDKSSMIVKGTLKVKGTVDEPVLFQGDRFDGDYVDAPGQWGDVIKYNDSTFLRLAGINFFEGSIDNVINYAIIKNSVSGISVWGSDILPAAYNLQVHNTYIQNVSLYGIAAYNSHVIVTNNVIANCGINALRLSSGGNYEFYHSTISNYYPSNYGARSTPSILLSNYDYDKKEEIAFNAIFGNCIIDGRLSDELYIRESEDDQVQFDYVFDHCMIKLDKDYDISNTDNYSDNIIIQNSDSIAFISRFKFDFRLDSLSIAINRGNTDYIIMAPVDVLEINRTSYGLPDIGAFERIIGDTIP